jgi:glycine dehydrogenase subunit 1
MSQYIPNTEKQQKEMLSQIGLDSVEDLFKDIPNEVRLKRDLKLQKALSEMEIMNHMSNMASKNFNIDEYICFLGAGAYDHYIPSIIAHITSRQEFYTSYTPYQPEISQGTLQAVFEYQSMICELTGMDIANASMYDGATALAEAASMACQATKRNEVFIARTVHPESREVVNTYARFKGYKIAEYGYIDGKIDIADLEAKVTESTAAIIIQTPNFFGIIENLSEIAELVHNKKALMIVSCDPISLAILKSPGELGADIVVGEGQSLGNPISFGGPYLGFFATNKGLMRKMPGRIVGETIDKDGKRGFVLTIQAREQHIRRDKATSNICSNQALNALAATVYLTTLGKQGLKEVAALCAQKSHYAYKQIIDTGLFTPVFSAPFFKEFVVVFNGDINKLNKRLMDYKIIGGYDIGRDYPGLANNWLVAVTEKRTKEQIDDMVGKLVALC